MDQKQEVSGFIHELMTQYFEKRNMQAVQSYLDNRTSWIGTGIGELSRNLQEAKTALHEEVVEYDGGFTIADSNFEYVALSDQYGIIYGTIKAIPEDSVLSEENIRLSAVIHWTEDGLKLMHIHFSHADLAQEKGTYFVKQTMRADNQSLRHELSLREIQLANLTKNIPGGAHQCANDANLTLISMSDGFLSMFGYNREEVETQFQGKFINMIYPEDRASMLKNMYAQLAKSDHMELEYRVLCKNGQPVWVLDKGRLIDKGDGDCCFYCLLMDITGRKHQEEELRLSLERHQVIMNQATDIIFEWNILTDDLSFSTNWVKKFGYKAIDHDVSKRIPFSENIHSDDIPSFMKLMKDTREGVPYSETEFRIRDNLGHFYWCRIRATVQYSSDGRPIKAVGVIVDIDEEKKQKKELIEQAQHDTLTGIYNKATMNALVQRRMKTADQGNQALLIIDVDHFKSVNDTYGHLSGDSVLSNVATALKNSIRSSDLVGRIGGDEFMVYLPEISDEEAARQKAEHILTAVNSIFPDVNVPCITCSIGAVVTSNQLKNVNFETLYQRADRALYHRKNIGRGGVSFWNEKTGDKFNLSEQVTSAVSNTIVSDTSIVKDEWLAQYAFRMLYEAKDIEATINLLLDIIGQAFDVSRVYIFESSKDRLTCSNTFEWCSENVLPQIDHLQNIAYVDELGDYIQNFDNQGIFYCHSIQELHPDVTAILEPQGIRSMLQCAILDEGDFVGYVGFDECRENRAWNQDQVNAFKLTADVLSTFLLKLRLKQDKLCE